jgi:hypothetical protein
VKKLNKTVTKSICCLGRKGALRQGGRPQSPWGKAERSIWFIKELILLGSGYNILP